MSIGPYLAASTWGAKRGPYFFRRVLDTGRTVRVVLLLLVLSVFSAPWTALWVYLVVTGVPLGSLMMGLAGLSGYAVVADGIARWWWHPRSTSGPVVTTSPSGRPATAWLRSRGALVRPVAVTVVFVVLAIGEVVASFVGDRMWGLIGAAVLVAFMAWFAWPLLLGRARAGGLYLTQHGVEHVWGSDRADVPWEAVQLTSPILPLGLLRHPLARRDKGGWQVWDVPDRLIGSDDVPVPSAYLTDHAEAVRAVVHRFAVDPRTRSALGTQQSIEWARAWRPTTP